MEIIKVAPRGYCKGVVRAINMAKQCAIQYPNEKITVLGMLVHNRYVMDALELLHIHAVDDKHKTRLELLDEIDSGVVIFTAHGIGPEVMVKAKEKGLLCIDASCPDVLTTQVIVKERILQGYDVFYIGKKHHPEAEAICSLSDRVYLIETLQDIPKINNEKMFVSNQTTMSIFDVEVLFDEIEKRYPHAIISEEICNATRIRQEAVAHLHNQNIDVLYVVGDATSNNSNRLAQIAREQGIEHVYLIDDVQDIQDNQLRNAQRVAVTAGASTPTYLSNQVLSYLETYTPGKAKPGIILADVLR